MKTSPTILKKRTRFFPALLGAATASLFFIGSPAHAGYIVTLEQVGLNVDATGSGTLDLNGLTFQVSSGGNLAQINPAGPLIQTGPTGAQNADIYTGLTGPTSFGSAADTLASSGSGDFVGIAFAPIGFELFVPHGYVSGTALADSSMYNGKTFSSLGATPGTYKWTWGTGVHADSFTLQIGPAAGVPDSGSTLGLLVLSLAGLFGASRALRVQSA